LAKKKRAAPSIFVVIRKAFRRDRKSCENKRGEKERRRRKREGKKERTLVHDVTVEFIACTRTAVLSSFIRWNLGRESNPWFTIHAHVYQFRNDPIIRLPRGRSLPSLGPSPAIHCIKGECHPLTDAFRAFLFPTWYGGGVFMRIAVGFRGDKRLRESGFGCHWL